MSPPDLNSERGNTLANAGYARDAIGNLLGADGSEYNLTPSLESGLQHAVVALGIMVREYGCDLEAGSNLRRPGGEQ